MKNRTLLFLSLVALIGPAHAAEEAESGPRAERVIVTKTDGTKTEVAPPAPKPVKIRAYPSAQEIARAAAAAQPLKAKPLAVVEPKLANPAPAAETTVAATRADAAPVAGSPARPAAQPLPTVLGAPVTSTPAPAAEVSTLTEKDHESLRWLTRLRAKYPARYTAELVRNARARQLIFAASKLPVAEQEKIFRPAVRELEDEDEAGEDDHGGAAPAKQVRLDDEEEEEEQER